MDWKTILAWAAIIFGVMLVTVWVLSVGASKFEDDDR